MKDCGEMRMLIGIAGYAGSGKDTLADMLIQKGLVRDKYSFASPIKECVNALFGWDDRHAYGELKEVLINKNHNTVEYTRFEDKIFLYGLDRYLHPVQWYNLLESEISKYYYTNLFTDNLYPVFSPRIAYQLFGTEVGRAQNSNIWVDIAPTENVVIPDVRFPNEAVWLRDNGGTLIKIVRPAVKPVAKHESESYIADMEPDYVMDNTGSLEGLAIQADQLVKRMSISQ